MLGLHKDARLTTNGEEQPDKKLRLFAGAIQGHRKTCFVG